MKARLIHWEKANLQKRYVMEIEMYEIENSPDYPDGVKYSFILIEPTTGKRVLMDNHHSKGPHIHIDEEEFPYVFIDKETLFKDFRALVVRYFEVKI